MLDEVLEILEQQANIKLSLSDAKRLIGQEAVTAEREELDTAIVQDQIKLPAFVISHLYVYEEKKTGKDYVVYFIMDTSSTHEYTRGLLVKGKLIWSTPILVQEDSHEE